MKTIFWISTIITFFCDYYLVTGFVNIYFKNYNGGPASSSGSIIYPMIGGLAILLGGLIAYFLGQFKLATIIMGLPVGLLLLYMLFMILLPILSGNRWN